MFAIVEASGRQFQLEAGRFVDVDLTEGKAGDKFVFERVLMLVDGDKSTVGKPFIEGAKVEGKILGHDKNKKIIVYHMKPKKGTRKKQGHRQHYTRILIESIKLNDKELAKADEQSKPKAKAEPKKEAKAEPKKEAKAKAEKPAAKKKAE
ncbi:MAG TPA: 50S ribosomal protein L21 [Candidatus Melainabacteria bacterium]|nr:50S ribosomal protein L21 [Candidatus Melainabacteria bacterium]